MAKDKDDGIDPRYATLDDVLRRKIRESLDDPRPDVPAHEVFERIERKHAALMKAKDARRPPR